MLDAHLPDHPYRERPVAQLMHALAGVGRVTEALRLFQRFRVTLRDDIGIDPSPALRALEIELLSLTDPRADHSGATRPASAFGTPLGNLRPPVSSFVGRVQEVKELVDSLESRPLITLTGVGGAGKTTLAKRVATHAEAQFPDGLWFVDLASVTEPDGVATSAATALGARVEPGVSPVDSIVESLRSLRCLIVVDNCEHVIRAAGELVTAVVGRCPSTRIIATSRERLGIDGEQVHPVPPLDGFEGPALFIQRAEETDDRFGPSDDDLAVIETICRRLDGVPLAIELAAARTRSLTPIDILERLDDRLRLLRNKHLAAERHQTLEATIEWSYQLLGDGERTMFDRLSVFPGDFDVAAVHAVCPVVGGEGDGADVSDMLVALVDKSLVVAELGGRHARYRLLETLRTFAGARLEERGEIAATRRRHQDHFVAVAQAVRDAYDSPVDQPRSFETVIAEWHNFRSAVVWALDDGDPGRAAGIALLSPVFYLFLDEHAEWMNAIRDALPRDHPLAGVVRGFIAQWSTLRGDNAEAMRVARQGLVLEGQFGFARRMLWWSLAEAFLNTGSPVDGLAAARRALEGSEYGDQADTSLVSPLTLGCVCAMSVEPEAVAGFADRLAVIAAAVPSPVHIAQAAQGAGYACLAAGDVDAALDRFRVGCDAASGLPLLQGELMQSIAIAASRSGSQGDAACFVVALEHLCRTRVWASVWIVVEALAIHWTFAGRATDAAILFGYLDEHEWTSGILVAGRAAAMAAMESVDGAQALFARGGTMDRDAVVGFALDGLRVAVE